MEPDARDLAEKVLAGSNLDAPPTDVYERESGLRYWLISADGARRLFSEWIVFFQARPDYLDWAPFDVQDMMEGLRLAPAEVQQGLWRFPSVYHPLIYDTARPTYHHQSETLNRTMCR
jgi:hypothetical protein